MESITMLGTGNALVKHIYNTCFVIDDGQARLLVDAGGGNGILTQLDRAGIDIGSLHDIYVTHAHTDHILGVIWVVRLFIQMHLAGKADGTLTVRSHQKVLDVLDYNLHAMLTARQYGEIGKTVQFCLTDDGSTFSVGAAISGPSTYTARRSGSWVSAACCPRANDWCAWATSLITS